MTQIRELLEDDAIAEQFAMDGERVWVRHPDGAGNMRRYVEYHQSDDFWDIQVSLYVIMVSSDSQPCLKVCDWSD
jgi:hypothetical protein